MSEGELWTSVVVGICSLVIGYVFGYHKAMRDYTSYFAFIRRKMLEELQTLGRKP